MGTEKDERTDRERREIEERTQQIREETDKGETPRQRHRRRSPNR
jgi:hypothetical protein